ncbi:MAG: 30S ribosomal protein S5 [Chloroflexota bacterium]|nr:30S ribosomal protein S5 [Chloroflexota bacterium]MDE2959603.1 30S ribosomal protein S5 [Chloroflexota bacterium]
MVSPASRRGPRSNTGGRGGEGGPERRGGRGGRGRDRDQRQRDDDSGGMNERVVHTRRIAKVVKGGRRLRFNALVVVGDGQGRVGAGMGKALAIPDAVRKGTAVARRSTISIPIKGSTIPHEISVRKGASIVIIKPAPLGTGIIAAGAMRAMLELGGVQDVVGKSLGSRNPINIVQATLEALSLLRDPETERANRLGLTPPGTNGATATAAPDAATSASAETPAPAAEAPTAEAPAAEAVAEPAAEAPTETPAAVADAPSPEAVAADEPPPAAEPAAEAPSAEATDPES